MPAFVKTKRDEHLWAKAQDVAAEQGQRENWAYVTGIYKKMKGGKVAAEEMQLTLNPRQGYGFLQSGGDIAEIARALTQGIVKHVYKPVQVPRVKGAHKAFSFHWSNAQGQWDVIMWKEFPWRTDGAEFFLFTSRTALSPTGKTWSLAEMRYVAQKLGDHPGFASSAEGGRRAGGPSTWTVYLFSNSGKTLFEKDFQARSHRDAEIVGLKLVQPVMAKHDDAEDWVVEEKVSKRAQEKEDEEELAIKFLLADDEAAYPKAGAAYPGNMGAMEMMKFYQIAKPAEESLMDRLINSGQTKAAWELLKKVTGVALHNIPGLRSGKRILVSPCPATLPEDAKFVRRYQGQDAYRDGECVFLVDPKTKKVTKHDRVKLASHFTTAAVTKFLERMEVSVGPIQWVDAEVVGSTPTWTVHPKYRKKIDKDPEYSEVLQDDIDYLLSHKFGPGMFHISIHWSGRAAVTLNTKGIQSWSKTAKSNAKVVEVPNTFHPVKLEPAKAKRKEFPYEGFIDFQGIEIDVENAKGSTRSGTGPEGDWSTHMFSHYGEIRNTEGVDGDKLDVYVGDNHDSSIVVVIHQHNPWDGAYDEDKVMIGFKSVEESIGAYKRQYDRPGFFLADDYTAMPIGAFWRWVQNRDNKGKKVSASVKRMAVLANETIAALTREATAIPTTYDELVVFLAQNAKNVWEKAGYKTKMRMGQNPTSYHLEGVKGDTHLTMTELLLNRPARLVTKFTYNGTGGDFTARLPEDPASIQVTLKNRSQAALHGAAKDMLRQLEQMAAAEARSGQARAEDEDYYKKLDTCVEGHKAASSDDAASLLSPVLGFLRAMSWNYHTTHWQVTGSYGDHLMFQRLYEKVDEEIDGLAEKLTGLFGNEAVDGPLQAHHMTRFLSNFAAEGDPIIRALNTERAWQAILKRVLDYLDAHGDLGLGLDNMLRTFADDHETHSFLLQQRQGGIRKMATSVKNQDRQRRRAFTARCILKAAGWWSIGEGTTGGGIHPRERQGGGWPVRW